MNGAPACDEKVEVGFEVIGDPSRIPGFFASLRMTGVGNVYGTAEAVPFRMTELLVSEKRTAVLAHEPDDADSCDGCGDG
jgi:hypothetical protein